MKQGSSKLEKAEILQMTVDHLKLLHAVSSKGVCFYFIHVFVNVSTKPIVSYCWKLLSSSRQNVLQKPSLMVSDKAFFSFLRLFRREGPGGRLQDSGLQRVCWGGGAVPQLP